MKIVIVFTTKTPGGAERYENTWECIANANGHREKRVEVNEQIIGKIYVHNGMEYSLRGNWNYELMADAIRLIMMKHKDADFLVLFHSDKTQVDELYGKIKEKSPELIRLEFLMTEYSTTDRTNRIWKDHVSGFCNEPEKINHKFIALWKGALRVSRKTFSLFPCLMIVEEVFEGAIDQRAPELEHVVAV